VKSELWIKLRNARREAMRNCQEMAYDDGSGNKINRVAVLPLAFTELMQTIREVLEDAI
jgi:hypothetical protein